MPSAARMRRYFVPPVVPAGGVRLKLNVPLAETVCAVSVSFVSSTSLSPFQSTNTFTRAVLPLSEAAVMVIGTASVVAVPTVKSGMVTSSSSPVLSSPMAVPLAGLAASASVASVPMRMALSAACVATAKLE